MKAGWKTRIDERRYFEEKKAKELRYMIDKMAVQREVEMSIECARRMDNGRPPLSLFTFGVNSLVPE